MRLTGTSTSPSVRLSRNNACPAPATLALLLLVSLPAYAQNSPELSEVVVSATGFEQKITDAPASISVISREELASKPYVTLLDAVREIEGVDVGETTDKTGQGGISMRGMGADYTLILIDGRRQNNVGDLYPNNFGGNQFNHIPPLEMIERIEVIRGPMSTLYGADAMGGVINIITRKISDAWIGSATLSRTVEENADFGDDTTTDFSVMGPLMPGLLGLSLRGSYYQRDPSNPRYAPVTDPNGETQERPLGFGGGGRTVANNNWSSGLRLSLTPNAAHEILFDIDTSRQKYDNTGSQLGTVDSLQTIWRASNTGIVQPRVGYAGDQRFTRDQWALTHNGRYAFGRSELVLSHVQTDNLGRTLPFTVSERAALQSLWDAACGGSPCRNADPDNLDSAQRAELEAFLPRQRRIMQTRQTTLDGKLDLPLGDHLVVAGAQYLDAEMEDGVFGMDGAGFRAGTTQPHRQWAVFVEDNWSLSDTFTLTSGVRHDKHNIFGGQTSPRVYAVWSASPQWTLKGGLSTGYKTPKTNQLFAGITGFGGQGVIPFVGNPELQPETSLNAEIAAYYSGAQGNNFNATLFANRFKDKIASGDSIPNCDIAQAGERCVDIGPGWSGLGYTTFSQNYNVDRVDIKGVELAGRYAISPTLSLRANYTFTDSEQKSGPAAGQPLNNTARHMANATLDWQINDQASVYLTLEARSRRFRSWDSANDRPRFYKDYEVLHLGGRYRVNKHLTLNARINNLLDQDFTSYSTSFTQNPDGSYTVTYLDDYNNKAKSRNLWISANLSF